MLCDVLVAALFYLASGLSVIPIKRDGSKAPSLSTWKEYQLRKPTEAEIQEWFDNDLGYGIAILGGAVSGWLEIFDCDAPELFQTWRELVEKLSPGLLSRLVIVRTPSGGWHVYYRCPKLEGNLKLARRAIEVPKKTKGARYEDGRWVIIKTLLETRGEGGYALGPGSPPECHSLNLPYLLMSGDLLNIPTITPEERGVILDAARSLNEYVSPERTYKPRSSQIVASGIRPGDDYNSRADLGELLTRHGWTFVFNRNGVSYWKKPGKTSRGWSATTNYAGSNLLYVFSTSAYPFEDQAAYSLFAAYTLLEHSGDYSAAAKELASEGYGELRPRIILPFCLEPITKSQNTKILSPVERPKDTFRLSLPTRPASTTLLDAEVAR
jgi:putative DNA primase/helicase